MNTNRPRAARYRDARITGLLTLATYFGIWRPPPLPTLEILRGTVCTGLLVLAIWDQLSFAGLSNSMGNRENSQTLSEQS